MANIQANNATNPPVNTSLVLTITKFEQKNQAVRVDRSENVVKSDIKYDPSLLSRSIKAANQGSGNVSYRYDKETDTVIVSIHDKNTSQVIRQIPTQEFIDMKVALQNFIGKVIDIRA